VSGCEGEESGVEVQEMGWRREGLAVVKCT